MIKILFFIETLIGGGAEKVLRNLVNHMDQSKFDITVQTVWPCNASKYLVPGIRYRSMYASENKANRLRYRMEAESYLAYRLHVKDDYDIECAYLEMGSTKIMSGSTNTRAKKLAWVHCDLEKALDNTDVFIQKASSWYDKFDRIVCVSEGVKNSFDVLFHHQYSTVVLHNVIDDESIREKSKQEPVDLQGINCPIVVAVGRLSKPKNYYRLLKAHEQILRNGVEHCLLIIGEGPERHGLEQYMRDHGLNESVYLLGFRDNPYVYMSHADILACSSSYEGFSTFITEGTILGKAIITTDCFGMREILGDSEYGLITQNDDEAFMEGLRRMLVDTELRNRYEHQAIRRGELFSARELARNTEQFFVELLGV